MEDFLSAFLAGPAREAEEVLQSRETTVFSVSPCSEAGSAEDNYGDLGHSGGWQP